MFKRPPRVSIRHGGDPMTMAVEALSDAVSTDVRGKFLAGCPPIPSDIKKALE